MIYAALIVYVLQSQWIASNYRYCAYSNGEVHAIAISQACPPIIHR